jgi:hypothetical protein
MVVVAVVGIVVVAVVAAVVVAGLHVYCAAQSTPVILLHDTTVTPFSLTGTT